MRKFYGRGQIFLYILFILTTGNNYTASANTLPPVTLEQITIDCLEQSDWNCALDQLIPRYYDEGAESNLQYYISYVYINMAAEALRDKDFPLATELLEYAIEYNDTDAAIHGRLGDVNYQLSRYDDAEYNYSTALELDSDNVHYLEMLGQIYYLKGNLTDATFYWQQALAISPDNNMLKKRLEQITQQSETEYEGTTELNHTFRITFDKGMDRDIFNVVWKMLENTWYERGLQLDLYPQRQIPVLLLTSEKFRSLTSAPDWAGGVYEGQIKIPVAEFDPIKINEVISHEYTHALLYDAVSNRCPWWLNEGLAQYFSMDSEAKLNTLTIAKNYLSNNAPVNLSSLPGEMQNRAKVEIAYALGLSATDFLIQRFSIITTRSILADMTFGLNFSEAFENNTGYSFAEFLAMWQNAL